MNAQSFDNLFVLELANNHLGPRRPRAEGHAATSPGSCASTTCGRQSNYQFRGAWSTTSTRSGDTESGIRYIKKTLDTQAEARTSCAQLARERSARAAASPCATPFDESVGRQRASSWASRSSRSPAPTSTTGSSSSGIAKTQQARYLFDRRVVAEGCVDQYIVTFFERPSDPAGDQPLRIDLPQRGLRSGAQPDRLPQGGLPKTHCIGFSTHEYHDWTSSIGMAAYAKGARTLKHHIDIESDGIPVSPYCTLPQQCERVVQGLPQGARDLRWAPRPEASRPPGEERSRYLDSLVRGVYARKDLSAGQELKEEGRLLGHPAPEGPALGAGVHCAARSCRPA